MSRARALAALAGAVLACAACSRERPPHLLLVTADTLRLDHLSFTGYARETSPNVDAFRETSTWFPQAVTVIPKTGPSFTTMFTGKHPQEHGVRFNRTQVSPELPVLAEHLKGAGYATAAFVSNVVLRPEKGYARGFDTYVMTPRERPTVDEVNRLFRAWAEQHDWDRPTFCWIHYLDPHGPYTPPARFEELFLDDEHATSEATVSYELPADPKQHRRPLGSLPIHHHRPDGENRVARFVARYDAEIRMMDEAFGEVLAWWRGRGLFDDSAVVFTSDHGESLGEHDFWFEHGWFAYDATLSIPLLVKAPGQTASREVPRQVSNVDYLATFLGLAGLRPPAGAEGRDLLQAFEDAGPLVVESSDNYPEKFHGLRTPAWKLIVRERDGATQLYDLTVDPDETVDRADEEAARAAELRAELARRLAALRARAVPPPGDGPRADPRTIEELQRLGYGGDDE